MTMSSLPFAALAEPSDFRPDPRFGAVLSLPDTHDPIGAAWADGHAAGLAEARTAAQEQAQQDAAARHKIELALARLDSDLAEQLRIRLLTTVEALCEAAIAPLALDHAALATRVERAAAMLARADDTRLLRLHPADLALLEGRLPDDLAVAADAALERGALRMETASGGVEDGPAQWRRALAEALGPC